MVGLEFGAEKIPEEKQLEDSKHDKKLNKNNKPQFSANCHAFKTFVIKIKNPFHLELGCLI